MKKLNANFLLALFCLFIFGVAASGQKMDQSKVSEAVEQMKKLSFLEGHWEGTGWRMSAKGKRLPVKITEKASYKLGRSVMIIEGLGKNNDKVVHNALGFVSYDKSSGKIIIRTYLENGNSIEMFPTLSENKLVWGFTIPKRGITRFTVTLNSKGNWFEIGEFSRNGGKSWIKTMEMELEKRTAKD